MPLSEEQKLMRASCRAFVDDAVIPFIRQNWQREWDMNPDTRLPASILEGADRIGIRTLGVPEQFGGIELEPGSEVQTFALISEEIARSDSGLADKLVQNWKVSVLLRNLAPPHLQETWFKRLVADPQFLTQTDNALIQSEPSLQTNGQKVQAIRQAQPNLIDAFLDRPVQPKIGKKKAEPNGNDEIHYGVVAHEQCNEKSQHRGHGESASEKNVSMRGLAISRQHEATHQLWIRFGTEEAANQCERPCENIHVHRTSPCGNINLTHRSRYFLQKGSCC